MHITEQAGAVVVADLTDTLLQPHEAAAVFTVLVQQLQALEADSKLLVLDSAHEYLTAAAGKHVKLPTIAALYICLAFDLILRSCTMIH
jgi:hypothetical protein